MVLAWASSAGVPHLAQQIRSIGQFSRVQWNAFADSPRGLCPSRGNDPRPRALLSTYDRSFAGLVHMPSSITYSPSST